MNYTSGGPLEHLIFLSVLMVNYIGIKFAVAGFSDFIELLFLIPLKMLPFITAYIAYKKQIHETAKDIRQWFKKKKR